MFFKTKNTGWDTLCCLSTPLTNETVGSASCQEWKYCNQGWQPNCPWNSETSRFWLTFFLRQIPSQPDLNLPSSSSSEAPSPSYLSSLSTVLVADTLRALASRSSTSSLSFLFFTSSRDSYKITNTSLLIPSSIYQFSMHVALRFSRHFLGEFSGIKEMIEVRQT